MNKFVIKVVGLSLFVAFLAVPSVSFGATRVLGCKANYNFSPITGKSCKVIKPVKTKPVTKLTKSTPVKYNWCSGRCFISQPEA
jgi:hypothetical protein